MADIELDYDQIMQNALRHVVKDVLSITADLGETPGDHHFYIEFLTEAAGVEIPDSLRETYPERMTIVLHHQFEGLEVDSEGFKVTLWFKGVEARLIVPLDAITSFADPSAKFGLRFQDDDEDFAALPSEPEEIDDSNDADVSHDQHPTGDSKPTRINPAKKSKKKKDADETGTEEENSDTSADVVSLDSFRNK